MVEFIHNHDVKLGRVDARVSRGIEALNRGEDVLKAAWPLSGDPQLAESSVT